MPKTLDKTYDWTLLGIESINEEKRDENTNVLLEELAEILAVQFDNEAFPMFNAGWRPENAEQGGCVYGVFTQ